MFLYFAGKIIKPTPYILQLPVIFFNFRARLVSPYNFCTCQVCVAYQTSNQTLENALKQEKDNVGKQWDLRTKTGQNRNITLDKNEKNLDYQGFKVKLPGGLEPPTHALRMRCATNCATEAIQFFDIAQTFDSITVMK